MLREEGQKDAVDPAKKPEDCPVMEKMTTTTTKKWCPKKLVMKEVKKESLSPSNTTNKLGKLSTDSVYRVW